MDGRESRLTRLILSDEDNRRILTFKIKHNRTIVGTVLRGSGKKYRITVGDLSHVDKRVKTLKESILNGYSR